MARSLRYLFVLLFIGISGAAFAQSAPGEVRGRILDEKGEPVINAAVKVLEGQIVKGTAITDYDGNYDIKPIDAGTYDVAVTYNGYKTSVTSGVRVSPDRSVDVNVNLEKLGTELNTVVIKAYKVPLIDKYAGQGNIVTGDDIAKMATHTVNEVAATTTGVYQQKRGNDINLQGARSSGTQYIIDGVVTNSTAGIDLSQGSIDQVEVMTSGLSAKYGDVSGGVVNITTRGISSKLTGDLEAEHSVDGYNHNLLSFNVSSPLYRKKQKDGSKRPVMGFRLGGDYYYDKDRSPSYLPTYVAKSSVLNDLTKNPLKITSDANGLPVYKYATEYVTKDQLTTVKAPDHNVTVEGRLNGKLDFQLSDNMNLTASGTFDYTKQDLFSQSQILFAPSAIPAQNTYQGRGYLRLTQRFGKSNDTVKSVISNAYYSVQVDYQNYYTIVQDPTFKKNIFDYGYLGKYDQKYQTVYAAQGTDSATGKTGVQLISYLNPDGVTYTRSEMNPALANYTSEYYNTTNTAPTSLADIRANNALANGDIPQYTYGLFYNVGQGLSSYSYTSAQQYSATVDASFDLQLGKTKHAIEFGLYYQQKVNRSFSMSSNPFGTGSQSIWQLMRQLTNSHISLDKTNPIFIVNGHRYTIDQLGSVSPGPNDTIIYNSKANLSAQTTFDRNLRKKLGYDVDGTDQINVDMLNPNTFSLGMFTADELANSGNPYNNYYGYTYTGGKQSGNVSFNDYFTQKDANGNYTRPIGAFQPNYIAGYLLDRFEFKRDFLFNVGVRVDRYDNNQSVLKDPYSLYEENTVSSAATASDRVAVTGANNHINGGVHPSNIGGNYIVYVDDNASSNPSIIGYRSGDNWYDATGKLVQDPTVLSATTGRDPQPWLTKAGLAKITDTAFDPTHSFTNYTPQVSVMPRLSFSFPISDVATFYGHYDIYAQRPTSNIQSSPADYYYLQQNAQSIINNPDLKTQKTFDYEAGFMQKLSEQSSLTLSAFYTERKDMIAFRPYLFAYPTTYYTFGNRDFSTTKGLKLKYDLRRISHLKLTVSYTLQFAEGTGSTPTSANAGNGGQVTPNGLLQNFIAAGLPNLRYVSALDIDSRHIINVVADYRYAEGEGPTVGGKHILENAGVNFIFKARSGEPYTRHVDPVTNTIIGGVGGSRLPWHYGLDMRVDKDFTLMVGKRHGEKEAGVKPKKMLYLNAYVYAQNVLNVKDILGVYPYTGKVSDNGFLASSYGKTTIPSQTNPLSYQDLYTIAYMNPGAINLPRTVVIGLSLNF